MNASFILSAQVHTTSDELLTLPEPAQEKIFLIPWNGDPCISGVFWYDLPEHRFRQDGP
jgi:hypothetical protein